MMTETASFRYRLGLNQPAASPTARRIAEMAEAVQAESAGRLAIEVFPESRLGPDPQMLADLRAGKLEFFVAGATLGELAPTSALPLLPFAFKDSRAVFPESRLGPDPQMLADLRAGKLEFFVAGATLGDLAPTSALPLLPFAFTDSKAVFAALDGALGDRIRSELAQNGLHAFRHSWQNGFHHLTTGTRPIHSAADLKGLKIRSPGGALARDFFETLGAEAGYVPFNQMYGALRDRIFDGQSDPLGVVLSLKLHEVQTCLSLSGHWWSGFTLMANGAVWDALPRDLQDIAARNAEKFALLQRADTERINAAAAEELAGRGMRVATPDAASFRNGLGDFYGRWRAKAGAEAWRLVERHADGLGS